MEMQIASLSMAMSSAKLSTDVSTALLKMSMENTTKESSSLTQMIESCDPNLGVNLDALV